MSWILFAHISLTQIAHAPQFFYYLKKYLNETNIKKKWLAAFMWLVVTYKATQLGADACSDMCNNMQE